MVRGGIYLVVLQAYNVDLGPVRHLRQFAALIVTQVPEGGAGGGMRATVTTPAAVPKAFRVADIEIGEQVLVRRVAVMIEVFFRLL